MAYSRASLNARIQSGLRARASLASCAAVLLPLFAAADSQLQARTGSGASSATAHVTFKILIPTVLSLNMPNEANSPGKELTAAVFSNGHNVSLAATVRASDEPRGTVLLNSAARKVLAQNAACTPGSSHSAGPANARGIESFPAGLICTACMP
jgi:hypothetical protein